MTGRGTTSTQRPPLSSQRRKARNRDRSKAKRINPMERKNRDSNRSKAKASLKEAKDRVKRKSKPLISLKSPLATAKEDREAKEVKEARVDKEAAKEVKADEADEEAAKVDEDSLRPSPRAKSAPPADTVVKQAIPNNRDPNSNKLNHSLLPNRSTSLNNNK